MKMKRKNEAGEYEKEKAGLIQSMETGAVLTLTFSGWMFILENI